MRQPDFNKLFFELSGKPRRLRYELRIGACFPHDLVFLSSLVHDARVDVANIAWRGKRVTMRLDRDCWELGFEEKGAVSDLHVARSRLTFSPVESLEWRQEWLPGTGDPMKELWIGNLHVAEDHWDSEPWTFVIQGLWGWQCRLALGDPARVVLHDESTPVPSAIFYKKEGTSE